MIYKPNIGYTVKHDLCTGCGVCEDACPSHAIHVDVKKGCFRPIVDNEMCLNNKGCHRCYDVCPGIGVNLQQLTRECFTEGVTDELMGHYLKCFVGHSSDFDIRYHCASGGMVSQFLIFLLEKEYIDGAVVTAFNAQAPLLVNSYIARTREEVLMGKSSNYAPVSLNHAIRDIKKAEGTRYIIVGLPCHIEGFRKYEKVDKRFREKVAGYFAIYCSSGRNFHLTEYVFRKRGIQKEKLMYFAYRDNGCLGNMVVKGEGIEYEERFQNYYHPLRSIFVPRRCTMCIDHYGELADVSFGDIHVEPYIQDKVGINSLIVRNHKMLDWLMEAKDEGVIALDEILAKTVNDSQVMARIKKYRNSAFIGFNRMLGKKVPIYDLQLHGGNQLKWLISYLHTNIQQFIGCYKFLWFLIPLVKGKAPKI